jgi:tRNA A-37 threonylcarbamoyl transferase component Bud32
MNCHLPLPPCPEKKNWEICDPAFDPESIWDSKSMRLVKEAAKRKVFCCKGYYIKAFKLGYSVIYPFRDPAKKEWKIATRLNIGSLTAPPVAYGKSSDWSYFAASEIEGPDLESFLRDEWPELIRTQKKRVINLFFQFIAGISEAGVFQPDFHLNNVIFDRRGERFGLIDLHRAEIFGRPLNIRERNDQLSYIMPPLWNMVREREILEFTSFLSNKWPELKSRKRRYWIQERALKRMRRHWDKRGTRRILKKTLKTRHGKAVILMSEQCPEHLAELLISFVKHPEEFQSPENILKNSRHTLCLKVRAESTKYFLKAYRSSCNLKSICYIFKTPRVLRAWHTSRNLILRHISTPFPLVAIHTGNPWKSIYGAMLLPWIEAGDSNTILIKKTLKQREQRDRLIKDLAFFLWQMHEKGIFHGDCKITNFRFNPAGKKRFTVFDLDSTRIRRAVKDRDRISDITDMCASMEMWRISKHITRDFLIHYIRLHIPWEKENTKLLKNLNERVEARLKRKKNAC